LCFGESKTTEEEEEEEGVEVFFSFPNEEKILVVDIYLMNIYILFFFFFFFFNYLIILIKWKVNLCSFTLCDMYARVRASRIRCTQRGYEARLIYIFDRDGGEKSSL